MRTDWTDWTTYLVIAYATLSPGLVVAVGVWAVQASVASGALWAGVVISLGCAMVLHDLISERIAAGRQWFEIRRLRDRIDQYDILQDAEED